MFSTGIMMNFYLTYYNVKKITVLDKLNLHMIGVQQDLSNK